MINDAANRPEFPFVGNWDDVSREALEARVATIRSLAEQSGDQEFRETVGLFERAMIYPSAPGVTIWSGSRVHYCAAGQPFDSTQAMMDLSTTVPLVPAPTVTGMLAVRAVQGMPPFWLIRHAMSIVHPRTRVRFVLLNPEWVFQPILGEAFLVHEVAHEHDGANRAAPARETFADRMSGELIDLAETRLGARYAGLIFRARELFQRHRISVAGLDG